MAQVRTGVLASEQEREAQIMRARYQPDESREPSEGSTTTAPERRSTRREERDVVTLRRPQYVAVALGWTYNGLLLGLTVAAVFAPEHRLLLDFNQFGELWADVTVFSIAFLLMTWLLFFKLPQRRRSDSEHRRNTADAGELDHTGRAPQPPA